jgi:hypothetical protein
MGRAGRSLRRLKWIPALKESQMPNKRKRYRVRPESTDDLTLAVARTGKSSIAGRIADLSIEGVALFFDQRHDPVFALRDIVNLELSSKHLPEPLVVPSMVRHRSEVERGRLYGFEFVDWLGLLGKLPAALTGLFNQRGNYRVQPDPQNPVDVMIEGTLLPSPIQATLRDLSVAGISVQAAYTIENLLMKVELVQVSFELPFSPERLSFWGNIIHRDLIGQGICYGILFDDKRTPRFKKKQEVLIKYVSDRRQQLLPQVPAKQR